MHTAGDRLDANRRGPQNHQRPRTIKSQVARANVAKHCEVYNGLAESCEVSAWVIAEDPSAAPE